MILIYTKKQETMLFDLISKEPNFITYIQHKSHYIEALNQSITYLYIKDDKAVAYLRGKQDQIFGFYVYDLLVDKDYRGHQLGKALIDHVKQMHQTVYIMSDENGYYDKLKLKQIGSIYEV